MKNICIYYHQIIYIYIWGFYKTDVVFTDCQLRREGGKIYLEIIMCHLYDSNDIGCVAFTIMKETNTCSIIVRPMQMS